MRFLFAGAVCSQGLRRVCGIPQSNRRENSFQASQIMVPLTPTRVALSIAIVTVIHPLLTLAGYLLGMRPTAR